MFDPLYHQTKSHELWPSKIKIKSETNIGNTKSCIEKWVSKNLRRRRYLRN